MLEPRPEPGQLEHGGHQRPRLVLRGPVCEQVRDDEHGRCGALRGAGGARIELRHVVTPQRQLPGTGDSQLPCDQGGRVMLVRLSVLPTPNPNFRRVDAVVEADVESNQVRLLSLSTVIGRY